MTAKLIGILAGMGPRSTAPFVDAVVDECQRQYGARFDIDFPRMLILSQPTPFYLDRPIDHDLMQKYIVEGLRQLEAAKVSFIAMPCNSAHPYFDFLQRSVSVPLLNIITETLAHVPTSSKITLLATKPTLDSGLYQRGASALGCEVVLKENWQSAVTHILAKIKEGNLEEALSHWQKLMGEIEEANIDTAISACTDLNIVAKLHISRTALVDSGRALAGAVVREYLRKEV